MWEKSPFRITWGGILGCPMKDLVKTAIFNLSSIFRYHGNKCCFFFLEDEGIKNHNTYLFQHSYLYVYHTDFRYIILN
jgi:hypothetical protein